ncbi:DNA ligase 4 [Trichomonascus vanleenenianus]|uniref:DNA ligase (ATP) DNL4 n=1 Tax=Trichomonascus vanleenenianus TaxID=2268995 RepID=UPI003ECA5364
MVKIITESFDLGESSPEYIGLRDWRTRPDKRAGDFALAAVEVFENRLKRSNTQPTEMTIDEVNEILDKVAEEASGSEIHERNKKNFQVQNFNRFKDAMNANELSCIVQILLRNSLVGGYHKLLLALHEDAKTLYNITSDLERVCHELYDPKYRPLNTLRLMMCIQPQKADVTKDTTHQNAFEGARYVEEKLDGERIQMHMDEWGKSVKFFSKSGIENTNYGASLGDNGLITQYLGRVKDGKIVPLGFIPQVKSIILDGEMLAWDPRRKIVGEFGTVAAFRSKDAKTNENQIDYWAFYVVFDILYLNCVSLVNQMLKARKDILRKVIIPIENRFKVIEYKEMTKREEIDDELRKVIENNGEGIMVKNPTKIYSIGDRNNDWVKLKPEYSLTGNTTLDVVIVGAFMGQGARAGLRASYLCAVKTTVDGETRFISFCKVGGGFKANDFKKIENAIGDNFRVLTKDSFIPDYLNLEVSTRPHEWIDPLQSLAIEVRVGQMRESTSYPAGITIRFPRFVRFKTTEPEVNIAEHVNDLEFVTNFKHTIELQERTKKQKQRKKVKILGAYGDLGSVEVKGQLFVGRTFYVLSSRYTEGFDKIKLAELIKEYGGKLTNSLKEGDVIFIADSPNVTADAVRQNDKDVVKPLWVIDCIRYNMILPLEPIYIFSATMETLHKAHENVDQFSIPYFREISEEELNDLLKKVDAMDLNDVDVDVARKNLQDHFEEEPPMALMFVPYVFYFVEPKVGPQLRALDVEEMQFALSSSSDLARLCGAWVTSDIDDPAITHVIVHDEDKIAIRPLREKSSKRKPPFHVVSYRWIDDSFQERTLIDESRYSLTPNK